jgi:hypothetical protein
MTSKQAFHRCLMTTAILTAFTLVGAVPALSASQTETYVYKDIKRPAGHDRSRMIRRADALSCGASKDFYLPPDVARFNACMYDHGWALDHAVQAPAVQDGNDHDIYHNVSKQARGNVDLKAATNACSTQFGAPQNGTETSSEFKQCMLSRGWQYSHTDYAQAPLHQWSRANQDAQDEEFRNDEAQRQTDFNNAENNMIQDMNNTQNMINAQQMNNQ